MSDALIISLVSTFSTVVVSPLLIWYLNRLTQKKIDKTNDKVDEYHKEVNSKLSKLVVTEKALSFKEGEEEQRNKEAAK